MYCSSCGAKVTPGLAYCNRCGAELNSKDTGTMKNQMPLESLVWAIVVVAVVGVGSNIGLMALLKETLHFNEGMIAGFSLFFFLPFLVAEIVFIWLLLRMQRSPRQRAAGLPGVLATNDLADGPVRVLSQPSPSITENTTRTLEQARGAPENQ